jgi:hypothetical protein
MAWQAITKWRDQRTELAIYQRGSTYENMIRTVESGPTSFFFNVAIVNNSRKLSVTIIDFDLTFPWNDPNFRILDDPRELVPAKDYYSVLGTTECYKRELAINHRRYGEGKLEPGETIEGYLLGCGYVPIPRDILTGTTIDTRLSVLDSRGGRHSCTLEATVVKSLSGRWDEQNIISKTM